MAVSRKVKPANLDIQIWAQNGNTQFPTQVKYDAGWNFEVPIDEEENYIQNQQDQAIANINQQGVPDYDSTTTYWINSWVTYDDGVDVLKYVSLQDSNIGNTPNPAGNAFWVRLDTFESTAQTFADSRLENVSVSASSAVAAVDLNNVTDLQGDDPALETLAAKIGNDSGLVKADQILKTDSSGNLTVNTYFGTNASMQGYTAYASSAVLTPNPFQARVSANSSNGLVLTGEGTSRDISFYNQSASLSAAVRSNSVNWDFKGQIKLSNSSNTDMESYPAIMLGNSTNGLMLRGDGSTLDLTVRNSGNSTVFAIPAGTRNTLSTGKTTWHNTDDTSNPSGSELGQIYGSVSDGITIQGTGSSNDLRIRNKNGNTAALLPTGSLYLESNSAVSTSDNSKKLATTEFVRDISDSLRPVSGQDSVDFNTGTTQCTSSLAVTSFQLGATGKALIEGWYEFGTRGTSSTGTATLTTEIKNGASVLKGKNSAVNTATGVQSASSYLNYVLSGSAFQTFSSITIDLDSPSSQVNRLSVAYRVTPY